MDEEQFHKIAKALADPTRFAILERVAACREMPCSDLYGSLSVSQPTISHHLKDLVNAGLLEARREARYSYLKLRRPVWAEYLRELRRRIPAK